jgi:hypothetical protein
LKLKWQEKNVNVKQKIIMAENCNCEVSLRNLGLNPCGLDEFGDKITGIILFPTYQKDRSTRNALEIIDIIDSTVFNGLIYNADPFQRFHPIMGLKDATIPAQEIQYQTFADGERYPTGKSIMQFTASLPRASFTWIGKFNSNKCIPLSAILVGKNGNLLGVDTGSEAAVYGFELNEKTLNAIYNFATDTTISMTSITFDFKENVDMSKAIVLPVEFITADLNTRGMIDCISVDLNSEEDTIKFKVYEQARNAKETLPVADLTGFVLKNASGTTITTSPTEPFDGTYHLSGTIPAGTYTVQEKITTNGYYIPALTIVVTA